MIDLRDIPEDDLGQTQKEVRRHVIERGWKAYIPYRGSSHYFFTRPDGKKMHSFSTMSPATSYAAASLANDKFATYELLKDASIPQLETIKVSGVQDIEEAKQFLTEQGKVVVKPIDGGHGKGITVDITEEGDLSVAIETALKETKNVHAALIQKQYDHSPIHDLRIVYIGYQYAAAIQRVAARVFGDGKHTVEELITIENQSDRRGKAYHAPLATINIEHAKLYLKEKISDVPEVNEEVQVLGIANYGAGGETVDVTDNIPDWLIERGEKIVRVCELDVAGVDFMLARFPDKQHSEEMLDAALTEVNKAPLLTMHDTPTSGISRGVMSRYMDYLESIE
jgi:cyanophycin synthetase